jgi:hypothetical protein
MKSEQSLGRHQEAIDIALGGIRRLSTDPAVAAWQLMFLFKELSDSYEATGQLHLAASAMAMSSVVAQNAPSEHDVVRRWLAAEASTRLRRIGSLRAARAHMEVAVQGIMTLMETADPETRESAIETLLDDAELCIDEGNVNAARAAIAIARLAIEHTK